MHSCVLRDCEQYCGQEQHHLFVPHSPAYLQTHATPLLLAPLGKTSTPTMHFTTTHAVGHAVGSWPGIMKY